MTKGLTPNEASEYAKCDVATLRRAVKVQRLQAFRINGGRCVRYRAEDIDRWLQSVPAGVQS